MAEDQRENNENDRSRFRPLRSELTTFAELLALSGLLIAQPIFDFLGKNARQMIVFRLTTPNVELFVLLVLFAPPAAALAFEVVVGAIWPRVRSRVHLAVMALAIGVIAGNYLKVATHVGAVPRIVASVIVCVGVGYYIIRSSVPQQWLRFLAIAPLIFALLFVTASPASILIFQDAKAASVNIAHPARVVMIVFDEFPEESLLDGTGHVDAGLFPNIAALARDSTWYRNETTVAEYTARAVPAILTGRLPALNSALPLSSKYPQSLFTLLGKTYKMQAHEFYEQLCPVSMCVEPTFKTPLDNMLDASSRVMRNLMVLDRKSWDDNVGFRFGADVLPGNQAPATIGQDFLASLRPSTKPTLDYLHLMIPHQPWHLVGAERDRGRTAVPNQALAPPFDLRKFDLGRQMHLLQVQTTDWYVGQVVAKLKAMGEYDNTMIVITADHGVYFPYRRDTSLDDFDSIMWTPLFIKAPHQGVGQQAVGRIDDRPMLSIDVLPTMADILGVKIPWKIDGRSALAAPRPEGGVAIIRNDIGERGHNQIFDGTRGFAKVLRARAALPGGDAALRLYRVGRYGSLIGRDAPSLALGPPAQLRGVLTTPGNWNNVDPSANFIPFTTASGSFAGIPGRTIAIAVNGRIAGLTIVPRVSRFYALLVPEYFKAGKNDVRAYLVSGLPASPALSAISAISPTPVGPPQ